MNEVLKYWPVVVFVAVVVWFAFSEAAIDTHKIKLHVPIDHGQEFAQRALVVGVGAGAMAGFLPSWWTLLPLLVLGAFLFSAVFRYRLNKLRGKHACYIAPWSNVYDRAFYTAGWIVHGIGRAFRARSIKEFFSIVGYHIPDVCALHVDMQLYVASSGMVTRRMVHRSGRLAYITEITLSLLSLVVLGVMVNGQIQ